MKVYVLLHIGMHPDNDFIAGVFDTIDHADAAKHDYWEFPAYKHSIFEIATYELNKRYTS